MNLDLAAPLDQLRAQPIAEAGVMIGPIFLLSGSSQSPALHNDLVPFLRDLPLHLNIIPVNHLDLLSS
jgi:hypothetical protein